MHHIYFLISSIAQVMSRDCLTSKQMQKACRSSSNGIQMHALQAKYLSFFPDDNLKIARFLKTTAEEIYFFTN